jgi:hypothetical protein
MARITRRALIAAAGAAGLIAAVSGSGVAVASQRPAVSGPEHFQIISTSETSNTAPEISYGVVTGHGTDLMGSKVDTIKFANGSFNVTHSPGKGPQSFDAKTCLFLLDQHGTYTIGHGTGAYKGITGSGTYQVSVIGIGTKAGGQCSQSKPPVAFQLVIQGTGTVSR